MPRLIHIITAGALTLGVGLSFTQESVGEGEFAYRPPNQIYRTHNNWDGQISPELWETRAPGLPLKTPYEAIVLASIIEKEAIRDEDRARIAGVFYNRLRQGMRLQSDATVLYAVTKGTYRLRRALTHHDLAIGSPYNTYQHDGLPPQPICTPSQASLDAALHPATSNYLFFVADGRGGHMFAATMDQHNRNILRQRWQSPVEQ